MVIIKSTVSMKKKPRQLNNSPGLPSSGVATTQGNEWMTELIEHYTYN